MSVPSGLPTKRAPGLRARMHVLLTVIGLLSVIIQLRFRVRAGSPTVIAALNLLLIGLHGLFLMKAILWRGRRSDLVPGFLLFIERTSAVGVLAFFGYSLFLLANANFSSSLTYREKAEITAISRGEIAFWGSVPYASADLRFPERNRRVDRVLLWADERDRLWGGEPVVVQFRQGFFKVPWIMNINLDAERQSQEVLHVTPGAAHALYLLTHVYLSRMRWEEARATAVAYVSQYPEDNDVARHIGEILDAADRFPDVVAVLERVKQPDYDVSVLLGRALAKVNRAADGITVLERATRLQPDEPDAYRELGLIRLAAGDVARAVRLFEEVLQLQPRSPDVRAQLRRLQQIR